jgi:chemotaxis protein MotB
MAGGGEEKQPIIIKKIKKGGGHGHHGGAWKVAYADLVTAMMALFMVLWLVAQSPKTASAVGAYFRDPLGMAGGGNTELNTGPSSGGAGFFDGGNTAVAIDTEFTGGRRGELSRRAEQEMLELSNARSKLAQALLSLRMDTWARHVEMTAVEEGLRIEIQDSEDVELFRSGSATLSAEAYGTLTTIAKELSLLPNRVVIEGHTDGSPAARGKQSNWELSTERANAARRFLTGAGLREEQVVEIRGYADRRLRLWHDPLNPRNRRISILVLLERSGPGPSMGKEAKEGPPPHPLVQRLRELDYAAQGPKDTLEIGPGGAAQPVTEDQLEGLDAGEAGSADAAFEQSP